MDFGKGIFNFNEQKIEPVRFWYHQLKEIYLRWLERQKKPKMISRTRSHK